MSPFLTASLTLVRSYWREAVLTFTATFCFWAGYHLHTLQDASSELAKQNAAIAAYLKGEEYRHAIHAAFVQGQQSREGELKVTKKQLEAYRAKNPRRVNPVLDPDVVQAIDR